MFFHQPYVLMYGPQTGVFVERGVPYRDQGATAVDNSAKHQLDVTVHGVDAVDASKLTPSGEQARL